MGKQQIVHYKGFVSDGSVGINYVIQLPLMFRKNSCQISKRQYADLVLSKYVC